jgi:hypothetical protein
LLTGFERNARGAGTNQLRDANQSYEDKLDRLLHFQYTALNKEGVNVTDKSDGFYVGKQSSGTDSG